jgi:hypothetical protein
MIALGLLLWLAMQGLSVASNTTMCNGNPNSPPVPIQVTVGTETRSGNDQVVLNDAGGAAHQYPAGISIAPLDPTTTDPMHHGNAIVTVTCDTSGDKLTLTNALITATAPVSNYLITFVATYTDPPTSTPAVNVWYKLSGSGSFTRPNGLPTTLDKIVAKGQVLNPVATGSWKPTGSELTLSKTVQTGGPYDFFSSTKSWKWPRPPELSGLRQLKGTLTITLRTVNDQISLPVGVTLENTSSGGIDDPGLSSACGGIMSTTCATTASINATAQALGCAECIDQASLDSPQQKAEHFVKVTWNNLSADLAKGQGEYLTSLATLLKVPNDQQLAFFSLAEDHYIALTKTDTATPDYFLATLTKRVPAYISIASSDTMKQ